MIETFITVLAWVLFPVCSILAGFCIYSRVTYTDAQRAADRFSGYEVTWPIGRWSLGALISLAWLIAYYLN